MRLLAYLMVMFPNISEAFYVLVSVHTVNIFASNTLTNGIDPDQMSLIKNGYTCLFYAISR